MNEEIKEFVEFRTDEDGTYFYYNDKDNVEQWSYKLDDLKDYIINLQQENARLKDKIEKLNDYVEDRISALTVSVDNKAKDEYFNNKCIDGVQELKNVKVILKEN